MECDCEINKAQATLIQITMEKKLARLATSLCLFIACICPISVKVTGECTRPCECNGHVAKCDCESASSSGAWTPPLLIIGPLEFPVVTTELIIQNCKKVAFFSWNMFGQRPLKHVEIYNVQELDLRRFAFKGTKNVHRIVIRNTTLPNLLFNSFDIDGIHTIEFDNVTIHTIQQNAFTGLNNVSHFRIINSKVGTVNSRSFPDTLQHVANFAFVNTTFESFESGAFQMVDVTNITFSDVAVDQWHSNAFSPASVRHISIRYSNITALHKNAFSCRNVDSLLVLHNRFNELYPKAFGRLKDVRNFEFSSNVIHDVKRGVLFGYDKDLVQQATIVHNKFYCSAALCRLLRDKNQLFVNGTILQNSLCHSPASNAGKTLTEVFSLDDDEDFCNDDLDGSGFQGLGGPLFSGVISITTLQDDNAKTGTLSTNSPSPSTDPNTVHGTHNTSYSHRPSFNGPLILILLCITMT